MQVIQFRGCAVAINNVDSIRNFDQFQNENSHLEAQMTEDRTCSHRK